jgi:hypothetical protein
VGVRHERDVGPRGPVRALADYPHHAEHPGLFAPAPRSETFLLKTCVEVLDQDGPVAVGGEDEAACDQHGVETRAPAVVDYALENAPGAAGVAVEGLLRPRAAGHALEVRDDHGPEPLAQSRKLCGEDAARGLALGVGEGEYQIARGAGGAHATLR